MLNILEKYIKLKEYTYLVMDGSTSVNQRPNLIEQFNNDPDIFIFLLTTRVGGLGVNLVGADRIIIFDPDWNPMIDVQARERAWRIGQERQVTIYRLLTTGTVEEKIYHRQIFKQYLTNKILKNPKQRRFFKTNDLYELFRLGNDEKRTESSDIFAGTNSEVKLDKKKKKKKSKDKNKTDDPFKLPPEKIEELREKAKRLSEMISSKFNGNSNENSSSSSNEIDKLASSKKEENNKTKGVFVEGKKIKYLDKCDLFKEQLIGEEDEEEVGKKQDEYVLKKLFKNASLHSALQHDKIEGATSSDFIIVEHEAERVANEAIRALQRSRESCLNASTGMPNWTGHSGYSKRVKVNRPAFGKVTTTTTSSTAKPATSTNAPVEETMQPSEFFSSIDRLVRPSNPTSNNNHKPFALHNSLSSNSSSNIPKNNSSASSLLDAIKQRNKIMDLNKRINNSNANSNNNGQNQLESIDVERKYQKLLDDLRSFIAFKSTSRNGEATTAEVLQHFQDRIPNDQTAVFKALLWKLCDFVRKEGNGFWILKSEFR